MYHYRKTHKIYKSFPKPSGCSFCEDDLAAKAVKITEHAYVIPNRVSYDLWEMREVTEHLMIVPKQHIHGFGELSDAAKVDIMNLMAEYEVQGYNVYARGVDNGQRSVDHQHTHLLRTKPTPVRGSLVIKRPYVVVKF